MAETELAERLDEILSKLMIRVLLVRYATALEPVDGYMYILQFSESRDAKYIAWNILEHIPENYFTSDDVEDIMNTLLRAPDANAIYLSLEDLNKFICVLEALWESGEINEWQCSDKTIETFTAMHSTLNDSIPWHRKFSAMQHLEVWTSDEVVSLLGKVEHKLNTDMQIPTILLSNPLSHPHVCKIQVSDAKSGVELMRRIRKHDWFNRFSKDCILSFEQFVTEVPSSRLCAIFTFNYDNMKVFSDIVLDL